MVTTATQIQMSKDITTEILFYTSNTPTGLHIFRTRQGPTEDIMHIELSPTTTTVTDLISSFRDPLQFLSCCYKQKCVCIQQQEYYSTPVKGCRQIQFLSHLKRHFRAIIDTLECSLLGSLQQIARLPSYLIKCK